MIRHTTVIALLLAAMAGPAAQAHEVSETVVQRQATVITLHYADGTPFAGESFELRPIGGGPAVLQGRTDARGRAVLLPDGPGPWLFRSFSDDGHGVQRRIDAVPTQIAAVSAEAAAAPTRLLDLDRSSRIVFGLGLLLAVFGGLQLWLQRRLKAAAPAQASSPR